MFTYKNKINTIKMSLNFSATCQDSNCNAPKQHQHILLKKVNEAERFVKKKNYGAFYSYSLNSQDVNLKVFKT